MIDLKTNTLTLDIEIYSNLMKTIEKQFLHSNYYKDIGHFQALGTTSCLRISCYTRK